MRDVYLITVGKLKDKNFLQIEGDYLKRISSFNLKIIELKSQKENLELESKVVLAKIKDLAKNSGRGEIILLTEHQKPLDSPGFSKWFFDLLEDSRGPLFLVIGGASGHGEAILSEPHKKLSLSPLTFPHQMARVILVEQLYRAQTIFQGGPYHK